MNPFRLPAVLPRLQIEITTGCNLKCTGCQRTMGLASGNWRSQYMAVETFVKILRRCPPAQVLVLQGIGEPTLHPDLPRLLAAARQEGRYPCLSFNSNILAQTPEYILALRQYGLNYLSVSVDALAPEVAAQVRQGTDVELLWQRLVVLSRAGLGLTVSIVISRLNLDHLGDLLARLAGLSLAAVEVQPLIGYGDAGDDMVLDGPGLQTARAIIEACRQRHPGLNILMASAMQPNGSKCHRPLGKPYVTVDGYLTPCCVTNDVAQFRRTRVVEQDLVQAWDSPGVVAWFQGYLDGEPEVCRKCCFNPSGSFARSARQDAPAAIRLLPTLQGVLDTVLALQEQGRIREAEQALHAALPAEFLADALHRLGLLRWQSGNTTALELLQAAVALKPEPSYRGNIGVILLQQGKIDQAVAVLESLVAASPEYPNGYLVLAGAYSRRGDAENATRTLIRLADLAISGEKVAIADSAMQQLFTLQADPYRIIFLVHRFRFMGYFQLATRWIDQMIAAAPDQLGLRLAYVYALLPVIYESVAQMAERRAAYTRALIDIGEKIAQTDHALLASAARQVGEAKPFYLSYQGEDDTGLQRRYGRITRRLMQARFPQWGQDRAPTAVPQPGEKIRVGFATSYFFLHSVSKLFGGWIRGLDRSRFELYGYSFTQKLDGWGQSLVAQFDVYRTIPPGLRDDHEDYFADAITRDQVHVLIYPELGMGPLAVRLANLRLAPVQCVSWGHPVTTGFETIDYFLSSDLMEPEEGERHYTERLVRLPGLSICYLPLPPATLPMTRAEAGLRSDATVFICCQALFKYRPMDDELLAQIARAVPNGQFLFISSPDTEVSRIFLRRLGAVFLREGLDLQRHVVITPPVVSEKFPALLKLGDLYLDSVAWSGGNTTLEAVSCGLPVVTLPGAMMRGRHTTAILRYLGFEELIARDRQDYVAIASRLALDVAYRREMAARILAAAPRLFGDMAPVRALEAFMAEALAAVAAGMMREPGTGSL